MNKVCLIGRLISKPELRYTNSNIAVTKFSIAVNRRTKEDGTKEADFINCIAWKTTAETICKYFDKGSQIGIEGRIQTGSYDDKDGKKIYTTDIIAELITFIDNKKNENSNVSPYDYQKEEEKDPFADFGETVVSIDDSFLD